MRRLSNAVLVLGRGQGETRAADAARMAISSPLLDISMEGAKGVLLNITGSHDLTLAEINEAADIVAQAANPDATIRFGVVIAPRLENGVTITFVATGYDRPQRQLHGGAGPHGGGDHPRRTLPRSARSSRAAPAHRVTTPWPSQSPLGTPRPRSFPSR